MGQSKSRIPEDANSRKQNGPRVIYSGPPDSRIYFYGEPSAYRHEQGNVYEKEDFIPDVHYQGGSSHDHQHAVSQKYKKKDKKKKNGKKSKKSKNESDPERSVSRRQQHEKKGEVHTAVQHSMASGTQMRDQYRDPTPVSASGGMSSGGMMNMNYHDGSHALYNAGPSTSFPEKRQEIVKTNTDLNEKITNDEELRRQREINKQLQAEKNDLLNRNEALKEEVKRIKQELEKTNRDLNEKIKNDEELRRQREINRQLQAENNDLLNRKEALNEEVRKIKQDLHNRNRDLNEKIRTQEEDLQRKTEKIKQLEADKNDLLNRLSSEAAARMTHNNPNITDLSDENRPTKISERYAELYDNQWTDAFEQLQKNHKLLDTEAIEFLLDVLDISFQECKKARSEREDLEKFINEYVGAVEDDQDVRVFEVMRILKGAKKMNMTKMQKDYTKKVQGRLETKYKKEWLQSIRPYMDECVEICLLMNIQVPALELRGMVKGDKMSLDPGVFKPYTKSGKKIEHIVWPALCLYKEGPLLCKGVAQGMDGSFKGTEHDADKEEPKTEVSRQQEEIKVDLRRDRVLNGNNVNNKEINKLSEQDTKVQASPASQGLNRGNNAHQPHKEINKKSQTQYSKPDSPLKSGTNHSASTIQKKDETTHNRMNKSVKL